MCRSIFTTDDFEPNIDLQYDPTEKCVASVTSSKRTSNARLLVLCTSFVIIIVFDIHGTCSFCRKNFVWKVRSQRSTAAATPVP